MNDTTVARDSIRPVRWDGEVLHLLDQRKLPGSEVYLRISDCAAATGAIRDMVVRGAPAIGITAAYAVALAAREAYAESARDWRALMAPKISALLDARPTAVNLRWAVQRMQGCLENLQGDPVTTLLQEAGQIMEEDLRANYAMGRYGASLLAGNSAVMTHCNAGALATAGYGTALGVVRAAAGNNVLQDIFVCETRPWLQGSRLTLWEMLRESIPATLITDSTAALLMSSGRIDWVIVGADRIAANGDVANKIGTYMHALCARHHGVRFMVVAPLSTIDLSTATGADIEIEQRDGNEILANAGHQGELPGVTVYNPVFDITPAALVDVLVTEKGVIEGPDRAKIAALFA